MTNLASAPAWTPMLGIFRVRLRSAARLSCQRSARGRAKRTRWIEPPKSTCAL